MSTDPRSRLLAVVPARGGSRRVPRKNVRPLHGRPALAYSIDAALESGLFAR
ncbi:MAG: cytidylyltransferase domain-containing protein, partial [Gemmatirosa sp.]